LDFDDPVIFQRIIEELLKQDEFVRVNDKGNNQYSNTLKYYLRFLYAKRLFSVKEKKVFENIGLNKNNSPLQTIFYGTPGSGKSHKVKGIVEEKYPNKEEQENFVFRTTFHPDSDYASFVGCYKPVMEGDVIKYKFTPQAFTKAYVKAWKTREPVYLIIEEIHGLHLLDPGNPDYDPVLVIYGFFPGKGNRLDRIHRFRNGLRFRACTGRGKISTGSREINAWGFQFLTACGHKGQKERDAKQRRNQFLFHGNHLPKNKSLSVYILLPFYGFVKAHKNAPDVFTLFLLCLCAAAECRR
jgi:hypothetical protein